MLFETDDPQGCRERDLRVQQLELAVGLAIVPLCVACLQIPSCLWSGVFLPFTSQGPLIVSPCLETADTTGAFVLHIFSDIALEVKEECAP